VKDPEIKKQKLNDKVNNIDIARIDNIKGIQNIIHNNEKPKKAIGRPKKVLTEEQLIYEFNKYKAILENL